jgi:hypothetical protein
VAGILRLTIATVLTLALVSFSGCGSQAPTGAGAGAAPGAPPPPTAPASPEAAKASQEVLGGLTRIINDANDHFRVLDYDYDEDLLKILDRFEAYDSGKLDGPAPRAMPKLDEQEEIAHLHETVRRWHAKTGKDLRTEVDKLKAEVAERQPGGPAFYPAFHKRFGVAFDDLIPIEVAEMRERRNRYIHEKAKPLLDQYRGAYPELVRPQEEMLNQPPYNLPEAPAAPKP